MMQVRNKHIARLSGLFWYTAFCDLNMIKNDWLHTQE